MILLPVSVFLGFLPVHVPPMVHEDHDREPVGSLLRRKYLWAGLLLIFLAGGTEMSVTQWLPAYAERVLGFTKSVSGHALARISCYHDRTPNGQSVSYAWGFPELPVMIESSEP